MRRRTLLAAGAGVSLLSGSRLAAAAVLPDRPVRFVVPTAAAGGADAVMRIVAAGMAKRLQRQTIVENRPGADGAIAAQYVATSPPDGTTLLMGTNTAMVALPALRPNTPYDPFKAFTPVGSLGQFTIFLIVPSSLPVKTAKELVDLVNASPDKYNSASSNSASELAMLQLLGQGRVVNARYKGDAPAVNDMIGGQIQMMFTTATIARPFVQEGRVRALLTAQPERSPLLPDVPTASEMGFGSLTIVPWAGIFAPSGIDPERLHSLGDALQAVLADKEVREQLNAVGFEGYGMAPERFSERFRMQYDSFVQLVRERNIKFD